MVTLPQAEVDQLRTDRDKNWNLYSTEQENNKKLQNDLNTCQNKPPQTVEKIVEKIVPVEKLIYVEKIVDKTGFRKLSFGKKLSLLFG